MWVETQGEHYVKIGVMLPQAKGLAEAGRETWKILPWHFQGERGPAGILISDFQPSELWDNKFLLFKPLNGTLL